MTEERRLVTILFADVVGSTALGESLDPEDVRALMARLFSLARDAVERHGGRVEKFIGDAVMAVFGLPSAHDDDPARACAAALDLRDRVRDDAFLGNRIAIRLGLTTGEVIATRDPEASEFLVTGDPVNTAARLQQGADAWAILAGERTALAASARYVFGEPLLVEAKGKARRIAARPLESPIARSDTPTRRRLVGRNDDLVQLRLAANRAFHERRPYLASIVAPAGVGKSRLLEEFLDGLDAGAAVAVAQCLPYGQRLTFWPLRAILLSILGLASDASPDAVRDSLEAWLAGAGESEAGHTADLIAATIGAAEVEGGDRLAMAGAWRRLVELVAERTPLVLVIEDLHWSSDSLLDLVEAMLQPRADVPVLMIALARPELLDRRPSWGGGRRNSVSIALEPLPDEAVADLVADLLTNPSPAIVAAVVERADGNPFYAGEIVRSLTESLGPAPEPAAIAAAVASLPDTVHGTVLARLDSLGPSARRVVQLGSVLGRSFEVQALPALDPAMSPAEAQAAVDALADHDLVRLSGRGAATFRHILIREVAYGTLPRRERARLHAAAGTWLEAAAVAGGREDELAELVAFHLREATGLGSLLGQAPSEELIGRAAVWLRRAAETASAGGATVEAARHLEAAIGLSPREAQADLYERLGQIWVGSEQAMEAFEHAHRLGLELQLGPDQELRTRAQAMIVRSRWGGAGAYEGSPEAIDAQFTRIVELLDVASAARARLYGNLALAFGNPHGPVWKSDAIAGRRALELARQLDDPDLVSSALDALTVAELDDDRLDAAVELIAVRRTIEHRLTVAERFDIANMTAMTQLQRGNLDVAERAAAQARAGVGAGQAASWSMGASAWRAIALHALGRWDECLAEAGRAERSWAESELRAPAFAVAGFLAALATARGLADPDAAAHLESLTRTLLDRSDPDARNQRFRAYLDLDLPALERGVLGEHRLFAGRLDYLHLAASLLADRRHPADAAGLDRVVAYVEARGVHLVGAAVRRLRGLVRRDTEDLTAALAAYEAMGARPFATRVRTELGILAAEPEAISSGVASLEAMGDVEQAARVTAEAAEAGLLEG